MMVAVITGDIINSRTLESGVWMPELKEALSIFGSSPNDWEVYRGDSFQLQTTPKDALLNALIIKSSIKEFKNLDVRLAIGIGAISFKSDKITESNGEAFINSGDCFDNLNKNTLAIKTPWKEFDISMNLLLEVASLTMDDWSSNSSQIVKESLKNPNLKQKDLAKLLNKKQSNISAGLKRAGFEEIQKIIKYFNAKIEKLC